MTIRFEQIITPDTEDGARIAAPLLDFNDRAGPPPHSRIVAIALADDGVRTDGGLWGEIVYDWLHVDIVAVPDHLRARGIGTQLMLAAETIALDAGCEGIWLDTFSFQARGFYETLGYVVVGTIPDHPKGGCRYFMSKRLAGG